jgi:hypothetical protein
VSGHGAVVAIGARIGTMGKKQGDEGRIAAHYSHQQRQPAMWVFGLGLARNQDAGDVWICAAVEQQPCRVGLVRINRVHQPSTVVRSLTVEHNGHAAVSLARLSFARCDATRLTAFSRSGWNSYRS